MAYSSYLELLQALSEFVDVDYPREQMQKLIPLGIGFIFDFNNCTWEEGHIFEHRFKKNFRGWFDKFTKISLYINKMYERICSEC